MKRVNHLKMSACTITCLLFAMLLCHTESAYAQLPVDVYDQEGLYISSTIDVDGNGNGYAESRMTVEFDVYGDIAGIYIYDSLTKDANTFFSGGPAAANGEYVSVDISGQFGPVPAGHVYGLDTDGYITFTESEGMAGGQYIASTYAYVYFGPLPLPASPPDPCAVTSNPQAGYSSIVSTGTAGGSGTMAVSFSGGAYTAISPTVIYGPSSTPSSIAAGIAALITKSYLQYGLSAKAFGPNIIYSGNASLGTVSNPTSGPSFTTTTSAAAAGEAQMACKNAPQAPMPQVEISVVAWINGDVIKLPPGESSQLKAAFPETGPSLSSYAPCISTVASLTVGSLGYVTATAADKAYANAWLLKYTGNRNPGPSIIPSNFTSFNYQYRLFADYSPSQGISRTSIGYTPEPCGTPGIYALGAMYPENGQTGTSLLGLQYLLAETRVGTAGQLGWITLNGEEIPWVWSVIEFDQNGLPARYQNTSPVVCGGAYPSVNYQIFPTYSVYLTLPGARIGTFITSLGELPGSVTTFTNLPPGQSLDQSCIP